jgi:glycogen debranching enzyme
MKNHRTYWLHHPIPSVPLDSTFFDAKRYWQGPTWVNTNWLIIDGLKRYGFHKEAAELRERTLKMIDYAGPYEYFSAIDGQGLGAADFAWTAALAIDLSHSSTR